MDVEKGLRWLPAVVGVAVFIIAGVLSMRYWFNPVAIAVASVMLTVTVVFALLATTSARRHWQLPLLVVVFAAAVGACCAAVTAQLLHVPDATLAAVLSTLNLIFATAALLRTVKRPKRQGAAPAPTPALPTHRSSRARAPSPRRRRQPGDPAASSVARGRLPDQGPDPHKRVGMYERRRVRRADNGSAVIR